MPWSSLIKKDHEDPEQKATVLDYQPRVFKLGTPGAAYDYLERKKQGADFVLSDVLRKTTGVEQIEQENEESLIEQKVLEKVSEIQKNAFNEGFKLGKDEGFKVAFEKKSHEIQRGLTDLNEMMNQISQIKPELIAQNETQLIHLIYKIAEKVIFEHVEKNDVILLEVIKQAIAKSQSEEDITVYVSQAQIEFIKNYQEQTGLKDLLKSASFEASADVEIGGCIVATNYGEIDARTSVRLNKIWEEIKNHLPHLKVTNE